MKTISILFFLVVAFTGCGERKMNCADFHEGEFSYPDEDHSHWKVHRSDSVQVESSEKLNMEFTSRITWTSECAYELVYTGSSGGLGESMIGRKISVVINEMRGDTLFVTSTSDTLVTELVMVYE